MKKIKSIIAVLSSMIIASSLAVSISASAAPTNKQVDTCHVPQSYGNYCGPASMSQLSYNWKQTIWRGNTSYWQRAQKSQEDFVRIINNKQSGYLGPNCGETAWFDCGNWYDSSAYPAVGVLNNYKSIHHHTYQMVGGYYQFTYDSSVAKQNIVNTIYSGNAVLANGSPSGGNLLSNYPTNVGSSGHWITVYGYKNNGNKVCVNDPAVNSPAIWGFPAGFPEMFDVNIDDFVGYTSAGGTHGIIY